MFSKVIKVISLDQVVTLVIGIYTNKSVNNEMFKLLPYSSPYVSIRCPHNVGIIQD